MRELSPSQLAKLYFKYVEYREHIYWPNKPMSVEDFFNKNGVE